MTKERWQELLDMKDEHEDLALKITYLKNCLKSDTAIKIYAVNYDLDWRRDGESIVLEYTTKELQALLINNEIAECEKRIEVITKEFEKQ
jgi:hypothetical protein